MSVFDNVSIFCIYDEIDMEYAIYSTDELLTKIKEANKQTNAPSEHQRFYVNEIKDRCSHRDYNLIYEYYSKDNKIYAELYKYTFDKLVQIYTPYFKIKNGKLYAEFKGVSCNSKSSMSNGPPFEFVEFINLKYEFRQEILVAIHKTISISNNVK